MSEYMEITISAAHFVHTSNSKRHRRLHGHNWTVKISMYGEIKDDGLVAPPEEVEKFIKYYDHKTWIPEDPEIYTDEYPKVDGEIVDKHIKLVTDDGIYIFPEKDIVILPVVTVTPSDVAKFFAVEIARIIGDGEIEIELWDTSLSSSTGDAIGSQVIAEQLKEKITEKVKNGEKWHNVVSRTLEEVIISKVTEEEIWDWARNNLGE